MSARSRKHPLVSIVDFHHARGPEVEHWIGIENEDDISDWPLLPFLALADGAHSSSEDFSYFTLKHDNGRYKDVPTSLFGIACTRQLDSKQLIDRPASVTRSTVQKAVVVIADSPTVFFGHLKQQLSAVTHAWFAQRNFEDLDIIKKFQESLRLNREIDGKRDQFVGLSLRELVYEFKYQSLVLFKCMLLQPKMLFFGSRGERLCMTQFSLLSLIPGLLRNLQDCSDPDLNTYESALVKPTSVRTSDRKSLLAFMGLPLQIFGKGSLFGPYTPLQQLDILADVGTKSYVVGSTNSILLQQKDRYSDILINLDDKSVNITSSSLRSALSLSAADRRWIDSVVQSVVESWDESDPSRPRTMGFVGSEDYIRLQFEEYILSMVSAVKYHLFLEKHAGSDLNVFLPDVAGDPSSDFNMEFVEYWKRTENFRIFQKFTDPEIFDLVPPKHIMAGGLNVEDVQRRIAQQLHELGLDGRVHAGKEAVAKTWASGRNNISLAFTSISKNVENYREQRRLQALQAHDKGQGSPVSENPAARTSAVPETPTIEVPPAIPDTSAKDESPTKSAGTSTYMSWAAWAGEKRRKAFSGTTASAPGSRAGSPPPETEKQSQQKAPSLFSRWSKSSLDLHGKEQESTRGTASVDLDRGAVWEASSDSSKHHLQDKESRKSLPAPPLPSKEDRNLSTGTAASSSRNLSTGTGVTSFDEDASEIDSLYYKPPLDHVESCMRDSIPDSRSSPPAESSPPKPAEAKFDGSTLPTLLDFKFNAGCENSVEEEAAKPDAPPPLSPLLSPGTESNLPKSELASPKSDRRLAVEDSKMGNDKQDESLKLSTATITAPATDDNATKSFIEKPMKPIDTLIEKPIEKPVEKPIEKASVPEEINKTESVVKRLSLRLSAAASDSRGVSGGGPPQSPKSPPLLGNSRKNSLAARRALFEQNK